uniref:TIP_N domain-containing protein n=1 Tax=Globodera pallida TaxID=36090 RepID=A0A183CJ83_GLOPA
MPSQAWLMQRMCVGADEDREFDQFGEIGGGDEDDEDDWKRRARKAPNYRRKGPPINGKKFPTASRDFGIRHTGTLRSALTLFPSDLPPALASGSELPNATSRKFEQFTAGRELSPERQSAPPARPPTAGR